MKHFRMLLGVALVLMLAIVPAMATAQVINGFGGMMMNGDAQMVGPTLRLTDALVGQEGSAFETTPLAVDAATDFHAWFQFAIHSGSGADGMTFAIQNDTDGPTALGGGGGGLGYLGITPSVAVEFDTWDNGGDKTDNDIGIDLNGSVTSVVRVAVTPTFQDGGSLYAWVDYDSLTDLFEVFYSDVNVKPGAPVASTTIDLVAVLGSQAHVGFTASTGGATNAHDVEDFVIAWGAGVPTTPEWAMFLLAALLLIVAGSMFRRFSSRGV